MLRLISKVQQRHQTANRRAHPNDGPWPFAQWELDIMAPFSITMRQLKFLTVGIDYFTKWVEAKALAIITEKNA